MTMREAVANGDNDEVYLSGNEAHNVEDLPGKGLIKSGVNGSFMV
jgi:hypothetical protein